MALIQCPKCNLVTSDEREACPFCNTPFHCQSDEAVEVVPPQPAAEKRKMPSWLKLTVFTAAAVILLAGVFGIYALVEYINVRQALDMVANDDYNGALISVEKYGEGAVGKISDAITAKVKKEIVGVWSALPVEGVRLLFKFERDGAVVTYTQINGQPSMSRGTYEVTVGQLVMYFDEITAPYSYFLQGDELQITNNQIYLYFYREPG